MSGIPLKEGAFRFLISRAVSCATRFNGTSLPGEL
jgi:hypothetical protein